MCQIISYEKRHAQTMCYCAPDKHACSKAAVHLEQALHRGAIFVEQCACLTDNLITAEAWKLASSFDAEIDSD